MLSLHLTHLNLERIWYTFTRFAVIPIYQILICTGNIEIIQSYVVGYLCIRKYYWHNECYIARFYFVTNINEFLYTQFNGKCTFSILCRLAGEFVTSRDFVKVYFVLHHFFAWWRHQRATLSALLAICEGNALVTGGFPSRWPVRRTLMLTLIYAWQTAEQTIKTPVIRDAIALIMTSL